MKALTLAAAAFGALVLAAAAAGSGGLPERYLAPPTACAGATDARAAPAVQQRAMLCLVNWARREAGRQPLALSRLLSEAARLKGAGVVSCREFSHTPCGWRLTASVQAVGYAYASVGENLLLGERGAGTARKAVRLWLLSDHHRENLLAPHWVELGVAEAIVRGLAGGRRATLWVLQLGRPL
jgi:uncharacterized protein YkwD